MAKLLNYGDNVFIEHKMYFIDKIQNAQGPGFHPVIKRVVPEKKRCPQCGTKVKTYTSNR